MKKRVALLFGILSVGAVSIFAGQQIATRSKETIEITPPTSARISPGEVNLSNLSAFEKQITDNFPIGTQKQVVETYLTDLKITHSYADADLYSVGGNTFYAGIENIGQRMGFPGTLAIEIHLDADEKVDTIRFRVNYLAP